MKLTNDDTIWKIKKLIIVTQTTPNHNLVSTYNHQQFFNKSYVHTIIILLTILAQIGRIPLYRANTPSPRTYTRMYIPTDYMHKIII